MAIYLVYAPPGLERADGYNAFMVSTNSPTEDAARIKAEKLVGLYDGEGFTPTHFRHFRAVRIATSKASNAAFESIPDVCFQGAHIVGPRFTDNVNGIVSDVWPRLGRGGDFLFGKPWIANLD